ncbi:response regulator [Flagellimonas nanhaiensis]|uniref:dolichyl-phosphate beta-glucosyltransferase n=1 Tax=Flagellimonas nanhaiensis TaxID=2292706 RepID=A0A371JMU4_9FLAO|nr:response regulator [Allomuricauda nanhaiensis]RDY58435.1 response regulator [Allomuricauda nanhaiensis]
MKILAIDDQQLILLSVEKKLKESGYEVATATSGQEGIRLFETFQPHLVIMDMNMPGMSGLQVIQKLKEKNTDVPIMVMSGNNEEQVILHGFEMGIVDYLKKPIGLDEMVARVKRTIGTPKLTQAKTSSESKMIQKHCVGVIIPCYNEADRLSGDEFVNFAQQNPGYHLCFVNDGSTDSTLQVLQQIRKGNEDSISIYDCKQNGGKAEAVRQGMLFLSKDKQFDCFGYLDADLSTDFADLNELVRTLENSNYKIVSGSRISRMGADIAKESARKIISKSINLIIQKILGMPFRDTQCGAKVMKPSIVADVFAKPFKTRWLFDVEIFIRMRKIYGKAAASKFICEQPLKRWIHADGSKLSMKDSIKIIWQLGLLSLKYK